MDIDYALDEDQKKQREQRIDRLMKDPLVISFLQKHNLDKVFLDKNASYFIDWVNGIQKCSGCQGVEFCRQAIPGKIKNLYIDETGFLSERYQSCRNMKKIESNIDHRKNYRVAHISQADYLIDLHTIDLSKESKEYILPYTQVLRSLESNKGIYLYGQPGVGKSYLLMGVCNHYAKNKKKVAFVKVPLLIQDLKQSMYDSEYRQNVLSHLRFSEVLVLDDIGSESITPWTRDEILFPILDYRMNHGLKTYFTSNYTMDELSVQYSLKDKVASLRLMERIRTLSDSVAMLGISRR